jgi:hypothetical protein
MMNSKTGSCSCFVGTAVMDAEGNCRCVDSPVGSGGVMYANAPRREPTIYYIGQPAPASGNVAATKAADSPAADNTIFGFNPLIVLGAVAVGLYFMSSNEKGR